MYFQVVLSGMLFSSETLGIHLKQFHEHYASSCILNSMLYCFVNLFCFGHFTCILFLD